MQHREIDEQTLESKVLLVEWRIKQPVCCRRRLYVGFVSWFHEETATGVIVFSFCVCVCVSVGWPPAKKSCLSSRTDHAGKHFVSYFSLWLVENVLLSLPLEDPNQNGNPSIRTDLHYVKTFEKLGSYFCRFGLISMVNIGLAKYISEMSQNCLLEFTD